MKKKNVSYKVLGIKYKLDLNHPRILLIDYNSTSNIVKQLNKRWIESEGGRFGKSNQKH